MKVLITGGSGLLGRYLVKTAPEDWRIFSTYKKNWQREKPAIWYHLDIRNRAEVMELFDLIKPDIVIHCASIGSVDYTEENFLEVRNVNVGGLSHIVDAAQGYKCKLIYISTNAVFSGNLPPYTEVSPLEPVNAYGTIKAQAEILVQDNASKWLIIRPFMLYGWPYPGGRTNWAVKIIESLRESGYALNLVDDVIWMPTYAADCADVIWDLLVKSEINKEIFNLAAPERATLYQFGLKVCEAFCLEKKLLKPVNSDFFSLGQGRVKARRPKDTSYDLAKLYQYGFMLSDIKTGLEKMREDEL